MKFPTVPKTLTPVPLCSINLVVIGAEEVQNFTYECEIGSFSCHIGMSRRLHVLPVSTRLSPVGRVNNRTISVIVNEKWGRHFQRAKGRLFLNQRLTSLTRGLVCKVLVVARIVETLNTPSVPICWFERFFDRQKLFIGKVEPAFWSGEIKIHTHLYTLFDRPPSQYTLR